MNGIPTSKDGKAERFIVEVLAIPGEGGNPTFTVHMVTPNGEVFSQSRSHEKASVLLQRVMKKASDTLSNTAYSWLDEALNEGDGVYRP